MSDSILPKIFEGFPELANQADSLEAALTELAQRIDAQIASSTNADQSKEIEALSERIASYEMEHEELRSQITSLEKDTAITLPEGTQPEPPVNDDTETLTAEVAHWKEKYDGLASRFDADIAAAQAASIDQESVSEKDEKIAELSHAKDAAGTEIARLAQALAVAQQEADSTKEQIASMAESHKDHSDLNADSSTTETDALSQEIAALKATLVSAEEKVSALETAQRLAEDRALASEEAREAAAKRLGALIDSLNAAHDVGAA